MIGFMYVSEATLCVHIGVYQPCPVLKRIVDTNRIDWNAGAMSGKGSVLGPPIDT